MDDVTKKMLNKISLLKEVTDKGGIPITDTAENGKMLTAQKEAIKKVMKCNIIFPENPLVYYKDSNNYIFTGTITDMNNLRWQFSLNDSSGNGCFIYVNDLQLNDDNMRKLNLLKNYYENWRNNLLTSTED